MAAVTPVQFSQNGEYFAYASPDGTLKIWETSTGLLKHEYTPSSHLSATCTCIAWGSLEAVKVRAIKTQVSYECRIHGEY